MAIYSNILAWRIPWEEKPSAYSTQGRTELDTTERLTHTWYKQENYVKTVKEIKTSGKKISPKQIEI